MENSAAVGAGLASVSAMTRLRISAQDIAALGDQIAHAQDYMQSRAVRAANAPFPDYGFLDAGGEAYRRVLGDFEEQRISVGSEMLRLRDRSRSASGAYLDVEALNRDTLRP